MKFDKIGSKNMEKDNISIKNDIIIKSQLYVDLIRKVEKIEVSMNQDIDNIKKRYNKKNLLLKNTIKDLINDIKSLVNANKDVIFKDNRRYLDLNFVTIGYRKSSEICIPILQKDNIIHYIEKNNLMECLDIKKFIIISVLSSWSDHQLSEIGIIRKYKDNFYLDIKKDEL